jgi:hypothetical protein
MTVLSRASSNRKLQIRPLVRKGAPHEQTRNCLSNTNVTICPTRESVTKTLPVRHNIMTSKSLQLTVWDRPVEGGRRESSLFETWERINVVKRVATLSLIV